MQLFYFSLHLLDTKWGLCGFKLDQFVTKKPHIAKILIFSSPLMWLINRVAHRELLKKADIPPRLSPPTHFATVFREVFPKVWHAWETKNRKRLRQLEKHILSHMKTPNKYRKRTMYDLQELHERRQKELAA